MDGQFGSRVSPEYKVPDAELTQLAFGDKGESLHAVGPRGVYVWEIGDLARRHPGPARSHPADRVVAGFCPDGQTFQAVATGEIAEWRDRGRADATRTRIGLTGSASTIALCPVCTFAVIKNEQGVFLFDHASGRSIFRISNPDSYVDADGIAFDGSGRFAAIVTASADFKAQDRTRRVSVFTLVDRKPLLVAESPQELSNPRFSATGDIVAFRSGADKGIEFRIPDVAIDHQGATLAVVGGGPQDSIRLWNLETGQLLARLRASRRALLQTVAFSADGQTLAATGIANFDPSARSEKTEYEVIFWDLDPESWARTGRRFLNDLSWPPAQRVRH